MDLENYFTLELAPQFVEVRISEEFETMITVAAKRSFFNDFKRQEVQIIVEFEGQDYLVDLTTKKPEQSFAVQSKLRFKNGLQNRVAKLVDRNERFITYAIQSVNVNTLVH